MLSLILPVLLLSANVADDLTQTQLEAMSKSILADIEELRGDKYQREVKVSIADKKGFLDYVDDRMERTTTDEQMSADETVMKLLGLVDPKMDYLARQMELLQSQVGGFYDPGTESFCLMSSFQGGLAKIILAHELTHALDDQLFDIDGTLDRLKGNADAQMAYQAVVEGSGTSTMNEWTLKHFGKDLSMKDLAGASEMDMGGLEEAPAAMWKPVLMVYMRGAAFLKRTDNVMKGQMGSVARKDLERAFTHPPSSTEQVLHPEKYWDPEQLDEPVVVKLDTTKLVAAGWKLQADETLGEAILSLVTAPADERGGLDTSNPMSVLGIAYTNDDAAGWGGDRYVLLEKDGVTLFHFSTRWDTEVDADEFEANLRKQSETLSVAHGLMAPDESTGMRISRSPDRVDLTIVIGGKGTPDIDALVAQIQ